MLICTKSVYHYLKFPNKLMCIILEMILNDRTNFTKYDHSAVATIMKFTSEYIGEVNAVAMDCDEISRVVFVLPVKINNRVYFNLVQPNTHTLSHTSIMHIHRSMLHIGLIHHLPKFE